MNTDLALQSDRRMKPVERRAYPRLEISTAAELSFEDSAASQSVHRRVDVAYQINIEAPLQNGGQEVMRLELLGSSLDISRGGVLVRCGKDVMAGARCEVYFPEATGKIGPNPTSGTVRRSDAHGELFRLAIEFDAPLEVLTVADEI